jgi:hypothetical protein
VVADGKVEVKFLEEGQHDIRSAHDDDVADAAARGGWAKREEETLKRLVYLVSKMVCGMSNSAISVESGLNVHQQKRGHGSFADSAEVDDQACSLAGVQNTGL